MNFLTRSEARKRFKGKTIAIVGSGPGVLDNLPGVVDGHDLVVRINNFKISEQAGYRTDVFYSFFGTSIRKTALELERGGVTLCLCKCPNSQPIDSAWHQKNGRIRGIDFTEIYKERENWWFCDTYIPTDTEFLEKFHLLMGRIPTTGFACILDILSFDPKSVYLTGFDFFRSGLHNVDRPWRTKHGDDPLGHTPEAELEWLIENAPLFPLTFDKTLARNMVSQPIAKEPMPQVNKGLFEYRGKTYPEYIKNGNACQFIAPAAANFCLGSGYDIGAGKWPLPKAIPIDTSRGTDAMRLPDSKVDYIFSSHCLEHLANPVAALEHWRSRLKPGGVMFLYLPHPDMEYWLPQNNRKHLHTWTPAQMVKLLADIGLVNVVNSERDLYWSFAAVGFEPA